MQKAFRILAVVAVAGLVLAAIITSVTAKPSNAEKVWDPQMTMGDLEAKNYYIVYSDVACPYCVAFENAIVQNHDDFARYLEENDILLEVRVSDFLYEYGETHPVQSRSGAEALYCARDEGKFWDYYELAVERVWRDFFEKNGKAGFEAFNQAGREYWVALGNELKLGEGFQGCLEEHKDLAEIQENAKKSAKLINGMPYFKFNDYVSGGFDLGWGYEYVLMYMDAGLKK